VIFCWHQPGYARVEIVEIIVWSDYPSRHRFAPADFVTAGSFPGSEALDASFDEFFDIEPIGKICMVLPCVHGFCDRLGCLCQSLWFWGRLRQPLAALQRNSHTFFAIDSNFDRIFASAH
jgi:hypothetical protein